MSGGLFFKILLIIVISFNIPFYTKQISIDTLTTLIKNKATELITGIKNQTNKLKAIPSAYLYTLSEPQTNTKTSETIKESNVSYMIDIISFFRTKKRSRLNLKPCMNKTLLCNNKKEIIQKTINFIIENTLSYPIVLKPTFIEYDKTIHTLSPIYMTHPDEKQLSEKLNNCFPIIKNTAPYPSLFDAIVIIVSSLPFLKFCIGFAISIMFIIIGIIIVEIYTQTYFCSRKKHKK